MCRWEPTIKEKIRRKGGRRRISHASAGGEQTSKQKSLSPGAEPNKALYDLYKASIDIEDEDSVEGATNYNRESA